MLPLVEKVNRDTGQLDDADIDAVRAAGVSDQAIVDALAVDLIFNIMNRVANALDFTWAPAAGANRARARPSSSRAPVQSPWNRMIFAGGRGTARNAASASRVRSPAPKGDRRSADDKEW